MLEDILSEVWKSIIVKEAILFTYDEIRDYLKKLNRTLVTKHEDFEGAFNLILTDVLNWAGYIQSIGLYGSNNELLSHFIEMDYYIIPVKYQYTKLPPSKNLIEQLSSDKEKNLVLFGLPGMGKTTSMKMVAYKIITDPSFLENHFSIPFVVRLRELKNNFTSNDFKINSKNLLFIYLFRLLNLQLTITDEKIEKESKLEFDYLSFVKHTVISTLDKLKAVVIIDGFDELEFQIRDDLFAQIGQISYKTSNTKILLTSRTGEFKYNTENFHYYELAPLTDEQIKMFSKKWLGDKYLQFISKLESSSFFDTAIRPLILSFLCVIYKYNNELPNKPKFIYKEIIDLLLDRWDKERNIPRKSHFSNFNKNQKLEFISDMAFFLAIESKYFFSKYDIQIAYTEIADNYELNKYNFQDIIDEIEEHSGIFIQSGADSYEFPHKSIQEFLAAEYLVRYNPLSKFISDFHRIPNELAIVVSLCRNPNNYLVEIITCVSTLSQNDLNKFLGTFMIRLISEKVVFKPSASFAIELCKLIELFRNNNNYENYEFFLSIYNLKGISESFELLDTVWSCLPEFIHGLIQGGKFKNSELITLVDNTTSSKTITYFQFVKNWRYVRPYIKQ